MVPSFLWVSKRRNIRRLERTERWEHPAHLHQPSARTQFHTLRRAPLHASGLVWCVEIRGGLLRINYLCACVVFWYQCCLLKFKIIFDFQMLYQLRLHHQFQDADFLRAAFKNAAQQSALPSPCRRETATLYGRVADASRLQDSQLVARANRHERPRATAADSPVCAWGVCGCFRAAGTISVPLHICENITWIQDAPPQCVTKSRVK